MQSDAGLHAGLCPSSQRAAAISEAELVWQRSAGARDGVTASRTVTMQCREPPARSFASFNFIQVPELMFIPFFPPCLCRRRPHRHAQLPALHRLGGQRQQGLREEPDAALQSLQRGESRRAVLHRDHAGAHRFSGEGRSHP